MAEGKYRKPKGKRKDTKEMMELRQGWYMQRALLETQNIALEQFKKEKEWLLESMVTMYDPVTADDRKEHTKRITEAMQQALGVGPVKPEERKHEDRLKRLYLDQLVSQGQEIHRLRTEKEWVIEHYAMRLYDTNALLRRKHNKNAIKQRIVVEMKQSLKETGVREFDNKGNPKEG